MQVSGVSGDKAAAVLEHYSTVSRCDSLSTIAQTHSHSTTTDSHSLNYSVSPPITDTHSSKHSLSFYYCRHLLTYELKMPFYVFLMLENTDDHVISPVKEIVDPKNENCVIYSPSSCSKPLCIFSSVEHKRRYLEEFVDKLWCNFHFGVNCPFYRVAPSMTLLVLFFFVFNPFILSLVYCKHMISASVKRKKRSFFQPSNMENSKGLYWLWRY